jgi:hypothetical protein
MTFLQLSADNTFHEDWVPAFFLPHNGLADFPSVMALQKDKAPQ